MAFEQNISAKDIRRYHEGKMTPSERHAMEKAALDDPFLAEALEGYQNSPNSKADIVYLQAAIEKRIKKKKPIPILSIRTIIFRIAAMLVLILGVGWLVLQLNKSQSDLAFESLPVNNTIKELNNTPVVSDSSLPVKIQPVETNNEIEPIITKSKEDSKPIKKEKTSDKIIQEVTINEIVTSTITEDKRTEAVLSQTKVNVLASEPRMQNYYRGRVVDDAGNAVPFASITTISSNGTLTDTSGNFNLIFYDSILKANISAPGYYGQTLSLRNSETDTTIVLFKNQESLSEVVVTAYGNKTSRKKSLLIKEEGYLEPAEGWSSYNEYLAENLKIPEEIKKVPLHGEVTLSFDIDIKGNPVNITVERSLCPICDNEAIRLLMEGPKWKKKKDKKGKLSIKF